MKKEVSETFPKEGPQNLEPTKPTIPVIASQPFLHPDEIILEVTPKQIWVKIPKNEADIFFVRTFKYVRWDNSKFRWVIPNYGQNLNLLKNYIGKRITRIENMVFEQQKPVVAFGPVMAITGLAPLSSENHKEIEKFRHWMAQKRYSESTIKTYIMAISVFCGLSNPKQVQRPLIRTCNSLSIST